MRVRLMLSLLFGIIGLGVAYAAGDPFGLSSLQAMIGFTVAGLFVGYLLGTVLNVFLAGESET